MSYSLRCKFFKDLDVESKIKEYNTPLNEVFFKIYITEGIIFVDKYVNNQLECTVQCANRFGFEELTVNNN